MPAVLALLGRVASMVLTLLGLAQSQATADQALAIQRTTANTQLLLMNLTFGIEAQYAQHVEMLNDLTSMTTTLNALHSDYQQRAVPVTLPSPPSGYGGLDAGATGSAVWDALGAVLGYDFGYMAESLFRAELMKEKSVNYVGRRAPFFAVSGPWSSFSHISPDYNDFPIFDVSLIGPTSTVLGILTASNPGLTWNADPDGSTYSTQWTAMGNYEFTCLVDDAWLSLMKSVTAGPTTGLALPIWPGVAAATLSTPVGITTGLTITQPCDGVIVNITGVPVKSSFFTFDDTSSYRNLGALSFFTDDGEQEFAQSLGFASSIYTPRSMYRAAGVKLRTVGGVSGTVTPWVVT